MTKATFETKEGRKAVADSLRRMAGTGVLDVAGQDKRTNARYRDLCMAYLDEGVICIFTRDVVRMGQTQLRAWHLSLSFYEPRDHGSNRVPDQREVRRAVRAFFHGHMRDVWFMLGSSPAGSVVYHYWVCADHAWSMVSAGPAIAAYLTREDYVRPWEGEAEA